MSMMLLSPAAAVLAGPGASGVLAVPQFDSFKNTIITILASVFMIVLIVRIFTAWVQKRWGEIIAELAMAIVAGWFVFAPNNAETTIKAIVTQIFGA